MHSCSLFLLLVVFSSFCTMASASLPKGVDLPDTRHVNGVKLQRNGHGIRSISFFGYDVKVYVAGFYTEVALTSEADVLQCRDSPMQLDFTFLRSVNKGRVISAWQQQLEHSVSYKYDGYEKDRDSFIEKLSSPIAFGGTQTVQLIGDNTFIVDQGSQKGIIPGREFQQAFLSMWFGERAVAEDLKNGLLSGAVHHRAAAIAQF
jgi:hypothetical protein